MSDAASLFEIIDRTTDVGDWPLLMSLQAPLDTDGMPDNIEVYVNDIVKDLIAEQSK